MIRQGDKLTPDNLHASVREVCNYNIRKFVNERFSDDGIIIGRYMCVPHEFTPDEYADMCIAAYADIPSSAISLDNQLADHGFKTAYRFAHNYITPGFSSTQIVRDSYRLEWFLQLFETVTPYEKYVTEFDAMMSDAFALSYYYAQYLWAQNPHACNAIARKMQMPDPSKWKSILGAIQGIGFQFHPLDVYDFAVEHTNPELTKQQFKARYAEQKEFKDNMMNDFGIDTGCLVLSPKNREKLRKIVTGTAAPYWVQILQEKIGNIR
ncbi:hypothetical protein HDR66_01015 [bacterium]|nr:hypothetical protein [bacterium]